jgi:hypothetical protein
MLISSEYSVVNMAYCYSFTGLLVHHYKRRNSILPLEQNR